jgi:hypothetical protein
MDNPVTDAREGGATTTAVRELCDAIANVIISASAAAEARGAERMREAAVAACEALFIDAAWHDFYRRGAVTCAEAIRALPLPLPPPPLPGEPHPSAASRGGEGGRHG